MVSQSIYGPSISSWDVERVYPAHFRLLELSFLQISLTSVSRKLMGDFGIGPQISNFVAHVHRNSVITVSGPKTNFQAVYKLVRAQRFK